MKDLLVAFSEYAEVALSDHKSKFFFHTIRRSTFHVLMLLEVKRKVTSSLVKKSFSFCNLAL